MIIKVLLFLVLASPIVVMNLRLVRSIERSQEEPPPLLVTITVDTGPFDRAMRRAGVSTAQLAASLGKLGVSAAFAARQFGGFQRVLQLGLDEQEAAWRLAAVAGLGWSIGLGNEVDRRTEMFALHYREWPQEMKMTPRAAALRSVTEDVVTGRLCP